MSLHKMAYSGLLFLLVVILNLSAQSNVFASNDQAEEGLPLAELERFVAALDYVRDYYVEDVDYTELFDNAIRGMVGSLDPHSAYLDIKEFEDLQVSTMGEFGGLGIEVTMDDNGYVRVISPLDDTPAKRAGVQAGDLIVRIDDVPVKGMDLEEAVDMMRGQKGTKVNLTILREGNDLPVEVSVKRAIIEVASVKYEVLEDNIGYVRIGQFQDDTIKETREALKKLNKETKGKMNGLVLDLRHNPGGLLDSAVDISDLFLDKSKIGHDRKIVYAEGRFPEASFEARSTSDDMLEGKPLVVLVDAGSASASEIVAGALQDHERAVIMGMQTFGKGSVQTVIPLEDDYGLKLTTALYYTPAGRSIQATGVTPDIEVEQLTVVASKGGTWEPVKESDLQDHIDNGNEVVDPDDLDEDQPLAMRDYQLHEAVNLLKAMNAIN